MPMTERLVTLTCVSNEVGGDLIGNARWLGVPMNDILQLAGVRPGSDMVNLEFAQDVTAPTSKRLMTWDKASGGLLPPSQKTNTSASFLAADTRAGSSLSS